MDDAGHLAFELGLDGDDEALAADGDDVFLRRAIFAKGSRRASQAGLDSPVLGFHGAADAAEFGAGVVGDASVGLDLAAQAAQQGAEIVGHQWLGKRADRGAEAAG